MRSQGLDAHRTDRARHGWQPIDRAAAISALAADGEALAALRGLARDLRDTGKGRTVTYSRKAFFPVTNLCRDRCAYCTFRRDEGEDGAWTMQPDEIRAWAERARDLDCVEALMCLGDKPEAAFPGYRAFLASRGHASTIGYVAEACRIALDVAVHIDAPPGPRAEQLLGLLAAWSHRIDDAEDLHKRIERLHKVWPLPA